MSRKQSIAWSIISQCASAGVSMTPLAGTTLGWGLLSASALGVIYLLHTLMNDAPSNQKKPRSSNPQQAVFLPLGMRVLIFTPTILMVLMASIWSWYGGLPALISYAKTAANLDVRLDLLQPSVASPNEPIKVNVAISNIGPQIAHDAQWIAEVQTRLAPITTTSEDEMFKNLQIEKGLKHDMGVGQRNWYTFESRKLSERDLTDLRDGRLLLFVVGFAIYSDIHGQHRIEFCRFLQPPGDKNIWHLCASHNHIG